MITTPEDLQGALARLALDQGDSLDIEAKTFSEFSADSLAPSLCSLANLPGGGVILLGVNERQDDPLTGVDDPHALAQQVTNLARNGFAPPLTVHTASIRLGETTVVAVNVDEAPISRKPVAWHGKAYVRQYDGDYTMSLQEQQQLLRRHDRPRDDRAIVPGTNISDLDPARIADFATSVRRSTPALQNATNDDILLRMNALTGSGEATVAGLYALGVYPQQHLPHLSLTAAVTTNSSQNPTHRASNRKDFTGPLPTILDNTVEWVAQNISSSMVVNTDGRADTTFSVPLVAVREVVANALVHRDLSEATSGRVVELRLTSTGLVLTSPGGLWGLSVDQLGTPDGKSAVNEFLYGICRHVGGRDHRVIEAMGTGIRTVRDALAEAGLEPPRFIDNGLRFTVVFPNHAMYSSGDLTWLGTVKTTGLSRAQKEALLRMRAVGPLSNGDYRSFAGVDSTTARSDLKDLVARGLAVRMGNRRGTRYGLSPSVKP
ncbi:putative DNA binding domain-containing protein [Actinomyces sp. B33]|uniref:ATP-binding protein n=1 Tax=Actinomyces sp. B33 TaxID=2942131 RepID=UPI00233FD544|nr:RNA-binding domain-containing protein [Actinomyces sp. B33]MDC4233918.1 putative DNA binding domain-containing protein [Actinomyces sp. B33]